MDLKKRKKENYHLWFKLKSFSRNNAGDRTELQEQHRAMSKELKTGIRREVSGFESNFVFETDQMKLYSYIRSQRVTNNIDLLSDSGEDLSTQAVKADHI